MIPLAPLLARALTTVSDLTMLTDEHEVALTACRAVSTVFGGAAASIMLRTPGRRYVRLAGIRCDGFPQEVVASDVNPELPLVQGEVDVLSPLADYAARSAAVAEFYRVGVRAIVGAAFGLRGGTPGYLGIYLRRPLADPLLLEVKQVLGLIAMSAGMALDRARTARGFGSLADEVPAIIFTANARGEVERANRRWFEYTGASDVDTYDEARRREFVHPDDREAAVHAWNSAIAAGDDLHVRVRLRGADDRHRPFNVAVRAERDADGTVIGWNGVAVAADE